MQLDIVLIKDKRRNPILNVIFEIIWLQVVWSWFQKIIVFILGIIAIELDFGIREDWTWHIDVWVVGGTVQYYYLHNARRIMEIIVFSISEKTRFSV